jgi:hypothetical protein
MRVFQISGLSALALAVCINGAFADTVELVCSSDRGETHVVIDYSASTVAWFGNTLQAQITDTAINWDADQGMHMSLDRDTGTLVARQWQPTGSGTTTWTCSKATKRF